MDVLDLTVVQGGHLIDGGVDALSSGELCLAGHWMLGSTALEIGMGIHHGFCCCRVEWNNTSCILVGQIILLMLLYSHWLFVQWCSDCDR